MLLVVLFVTFLPPSFKATAAAAAAAAAVAAAACFLPSLSGYANPCSRKGGRTREGGRKGY